jgi:hypothetical protein
VKGEEMTLNTTLQQLKSASRSKLPAEKVAIMTRAVEQLENSGIARIALGSGKTAPEFTLSDWRGKLYKSRELLEKGPLILTFYRGSW